MRNRVLSEEGCRLFNISLEEIEDTVKPCKNMCLKSLLFGLFHTEYDDKLELSVKQLKNTGCQLYADLDLKKNNSNISKMINNAITNIILLILTEDGKVLSHFSIKKNLRFYFDIANNAYKNGDLNTANLIRAAINNYAIQRLKIKPRKKDIKLFNQFDKNLGDFKNACLLHVKNILEGNNKDRLPSLMIILIHLNKNKEYLKWYNKNGKVPHKLTEQIKNLENVICYYKNIFKDNNYDLIDLYKENPEDNIFLEKIEGDSVSIKIGNISKKIKKNKNKNK
jgi:hypothetical protein